MNNKFEIGDLIEFQSPYIDVMTFESDDKGIGIIVNVREENNAQVEIYWIKKPYLFANGWLIPNNYKACMWKIS